MKRLLLRMWSEDDGVLSFEWVLIFTVLVIGVIAGVAASRDAIVDELGDAGEAMVALDQTFMIPPPLLSYIVDVDLGFGADIGGAESSRFDDFVNAYDCTRGENAPNGQDEEFDEQ